MGSMGHGIAQAAAENGYHVVNTICLICYFVIDKLLYGFKFINPQTALLFLAFRLQLI